VQGFRFDPVELPGSIPALRAELRAFLSAELGAIPARRRANSWMVFDAAFSRKLGARGFIGRLWPKQYGAHERSALERYVVLEELLAAGAPVGAHWIADRQSGMALLRYGSEEQRRRWLPGLATREVYCCIGMSEPDAGSDHASVRTRATRVPRGWRISGQKIWTTGADRCQLMIVLVRSSGEHGDRQRGLSQFLLELDNPRIRVRPIRDLVGDEDFCEVFFEDARSAAATPWLDSLEFVQHQSSLEPTRLRPLPRRPAVHASPVDDEDRSTQAHYEQLLDPALAD
jgi:alkylation response protein AidB-like acyl-CoA dehydrogenase